MNRLAVVAVQEKEKQLLCITKTTDATGRVEAAAVKEALDNWGISTDTIIASSVETTSSNTGVNSGGRRPPSAATQQTTSLAVLPPPCCRADPQGCLPFPLWKDYCSCCYPLLHPQVLLELPELHLPPTPACYRSSVDPLLSFLDERLLPENAEHLTRGDYKELLWIAKVCLGGTVTRKRGYTCTLSRPSADSNARWKSKYLYVLKFSLLQHQIPSLTAVTKKKINTMSSFILFTYLSYWFTSPSLTRAASNDLRMFQDLSSFRRVNKAVSESCLLVLQQHTWYLTEGLVPVALFNKDLEDESGNLLAKQIGRLPPSTVYFLMIILS